MVKYACHTKTSNFVENFGSGMVWFESIRILDLLSREHILDVGSGIGSGHLVEVSGIRSTLPGLLESVL